MGHLVIKKTDRDTKRHARLCTNGWSDDEHSIIQKVFQNKWNIDVKIYKQIHSVSKKTYPYTYFNATQFKKFFDLVRPYLSLIPKSMIYKFDMKYEDPTSKYNLS